MRVIEKLCRLSKEIFLFFAVNIKANDWKERGGREWIKTTIFGVKVEVTPLIHLELVTLCREQNMIRPRYEVPPSDHMENSCFINFHWVLYTWNVQTPRRLFASKKYSWSDIKFLVTVGNIVAYFHKMLVKFMLVYRSQIFLRICEVKISYMASC